MKKFIFTGLLFLIAASALVACKNQNTEKKAETKINHPATSQKNTTKNKNVGNLQVKVTYEEAIKIFQEKYPTAKISEISLEREYGDYMYEVEGADDRLEMKMKIDATDKRVRDDRSESLDKDEMGGVKRDQEALPLDTIQNPVEMNQTVLSQIENGEISEWKLEKKHDKAIYKVFVLQQDKSFEVKIDAVTGELLEKKQKH